MSPSGTGRSPIAHISPNGHGLSGWGEAPLGMELRERAVRALESVEGVIRVAEHDNESWDVYGTPSGEALARSAANVVDDLAGRLRPALGLA